MTNFIKVIDWRYTRIRWILYLKVSFGNGWALWIGLMVNTTTVDSLLFLSVLWITWFLSIVLFSRNYHAFPVQFCGQIWIVKIYWWCTLPLFLLDLELAIISVLYSLVSLFVSDFNSGILISSVSCFLRWYFSLLSRGLPIIFIFVYKIINKVVVIWFVKLVFLNTSFVFLIQLSSLRLMSSSTRW